MIPTISKPIRSLAFALLLLPAPLWLEAKAVAAAPIRVLVLYSYNRLVPGNVDVDHGLSAALTGDGTGSLRLYSEFLDTPEFYGDEYENLVATYLRGKYGASPPDAIVAVADDALNFVIRHRANLFPSVPIVHAVVSSALLQSLSPLPADIVGVPSDYDYTGTIRQALRWHPTARRLVIVTGASWRDRRQLRTWTGDLPATLGSVTAEFWSGQTMPDLKRRLAGLGSDTVVFTPGFFEDGGGSQFVPRESTGLIARASSAPTYSPFGTTIGTGVVGGRMLDLVESGAQAGRIVKDLLSGSAPSAMHLPKIAPSRLQVDWRQIQRWGIDKQAIPADTVVHFRDPTLWEAHRLAVLIVLSVFLLQMMLIAALFVERRRRALAELTSRKIHNELAHASRLAVAGELTASIAHEINQPLAAIQTSADAADLILQSEGDHRQDMTRIVSRIQRDTSRATNVIRQLRTLLAGHEPRRHSFDAGVAVADVAMILRPEAERRKITLDFRVPPTVIYLEGDRTQIQQVLINLVMNAMDAVADLAENRRMIEVLIASRAGNILITVQDLGRGVAPENLPLLFESFFSTKQRGMGLGLSIARSIVESHGGRVWAENRELSGASFYVELPSSEVVNAELRSTDDNSQLRHSE
jgi:signal transduction histidine kinase